MAWDPIRRHAHCPLVLFTPPSFADVRPVIREESKPTSKCAPPTKLAEYFQERVANGETGEGFKGGDYVEQL